MMLLLQFSPIAWGKTLSTFLPLLHVPDDVYSNAFPFSPLMSMIRTGDFANRIFSEKIISHTLAPNLISPFKIYVRFVFCFGYFALWLSVQQDIRKVYFVWNWEYYENESSKTFREYLTLWWMITASTLVLRSSVMQTEIKIKLMNEWIEISRIIAQHNRPYHSNEICFALLIYTCVCVYDKYTSFCFRPYEH